MSYLNADIAVFPNLLVCVNLHLKNDLYGVQNVDPVVNIGNTYGSKYSDYLKQNSFKNPEALLENTLHITRLISGITNVQPRNQRQFFIQLVSTDGHYSNLDYTHSLNVEEFFSTKLGYCYFFIQTSDKILQRNGKDFGLSLILKAEVSDIANHYKKGFGLNPILAVHTSIVDKLDIEVTQFNTNLMPLGHEVNIPVTMKRELNVESLSKCSAYSIESKTNKYLSCKYSRYTCFSSCMKQRQLDTCDNFETPFRPVDEKYEYGDNKCSSQECITCSANALFPGIEEMKDKNKRIINNCECELPCLQNMYPFKSNFAQIHVRNLAKALNIDVSDENKINDTKNNYIILNLFIKNLAVMTKNEVKDGIVANIISDIGNNLSLLLGIGVFNIIEIIFCCIAFCFDRVKLCYKFRVMNYPT
uniref:Acid-sensing ion channel 5 n=1 Tax=Parastrongyloides trichosuri TaxID=131310 RepID=A0A0N4Z892_PARTI